MELNREILDRFVDGELGPEEMERVASLLAAHPEEAAYVGRQEQLRGALRARFRELDAEVPQRLIEAARAAPISWQWRLRNWRERNLSIRRLAPACVTLALGLIAGIAIRPPSELGADASGRLVAKGALARTLDTELASAGGTGSTRIGISFRDKSGRDCRTFTAGENAGLACHQAGRWIVEAMARQVAEDKGAAYRMAGTDIPDPVRQAVSASISGAPFDARAESLARDRGWPGR